MIKRTLIAVLFIAAFVGSAFAQGGPGGPGPVPDPWTVNGPVIYFNKGSVNAGSGALGNTGAGTFNAANGYYLNGILVETVTSATAPIHFAAGAISLNIDTNFAVSGSNLALASIASGSLLANATGSLAEPTGVTPSAWLNQWCSASADEVPYSTGASTWGCLGLLGTAHTWTAQQIDQGATTTSPGWYAQLTGDTQARIRVGLNATDVPSIALGPGGSTPRDAFIERVGAGALRFGAPDAAAPVAQSLSVQNVVAGTSNTAGANVTINGSQGTGTGLGGSIIFQVAPAGLTGTAQNALAAALTLDSTELATFAGHLVVEGVTSTGATGTGKFVFNTSPTLTTPNINVAAGTSLAIGGCTIGSNVLCVTGATALGNTVIGAGSAITSSGPGGALTAVAYASFGTGSGNAAQGGVITAGGPTGSATVAPIITYNAAGQLTTVSSATITPAIGSVTGLGTGIATALGVNVGTAGAPVILGGAGGTPSSINLTNGTALPLSTGISGFGTNVEAFLASPTFTNLLAAVTGQTIANLTQADQTLSGGANVTAYNLAAGSQTIDCGAGPLQYQFNTGSGSEVLTAPINDGSCVLEVINASGSATNPNGGAITLTNFSAKSAAGATFSNALTQSTVSVTFTNASPTVVSWASHGLTLNSPVYFTAATMPTGITADKVYYVCNVVSSGTFQICTSPVASTTTGIAATSTGTTVVGNAPSVYDLSIARINGITAAAWTQAQ